MKIFKENSLFYKKIEALEEYMAREGISISVDTDFGGTPVLVFNVDGREACMMERDSLSYPGDEKPGRDFPRTFDGICFVLNEE